MKKVLKSLAALMLALTILVTCTPQTAHAAALRDYAQPGRTYKVYTVLPGKVKVYANARVTYADSYQPYKYNGIITTSSVKMTLKFPKSQQKKIQRNAAHILKSSPVVKRIGRWVYRRSYMPFGAMVIDGSTHKAFTMANTNNLGGVEYASFSGSGVKTVRQNNVRFSYSTQWNYYYQASYATMYYGGNVLFGVCGTKKPTYDNNVACDDFFKGYTPLESCNLYNGKSSSNGIFVRY